MFLVLKLLRKLVPDLKELQYMIKVSEEHEGDGNCDLPSVSQHFLTRSLAISAIIIAIQMIATYCKKLKYWRKIVLVTNGLGGIDADCLPEIIAKIKQDDIELVIMYVPITTMINRNANRLSVERTLMIQSTVSKKRSKILRRFGDVRK